MPALGGLADQLRLIFPRTGTGAVPVNPQTAGHFGTAGVECWLRSVHSFLISCATTRTSPIWSSVAGYYSSHYSVRAICHVLGFVQLYDPSCRVTLAHGNGGSECHFSSKGTSGREHTAYWDFLASHPITASTQLFPRNSDRDKSSEVAHRNRANYADHVNRYPQFTPLEEQELRLRLQRLAGMQYTTPPMPRADRFPDLDAVQIVAFHRLVHFRRLLDETLQSAFLFWSSFRDPAWARDYIDYQVVEPKPLSDAIVALAA